MADKEAQELLDTARLLRDDANKTGFDFINSELDISRTFAKRAWSLSAIGHLAAAKVQGIAAKESVEVNSSDPSSSSIFPVTFCVLAKAPVVGL